MVGRKILSQGFTLMELLIVIAVIGILISVATASYSSAQKKARDSRRQSDMKAMQNALEQYYADNSQYPAASTPCNLGATSANYLPAGLPADPKPSQSYTIACQSTSTYCSCALLEGSTTAGNATDASCGGLGSAGAYYCVRNLQ